MSISKKLFTATAIMASLVGCKEKSEKTASIGYIPKSEINITDGKMTPEVLLGLGRLSDPQLSPDKSKILYGVSYTSIKDNRSCRNLFICDRDGGNNAQLTFEGQSISNARWSGDGKRIYFIQVGQIKCADIKTTKDGQSKLGKFKTLSNFGRGIEGFSISPTQDKILFTSRINGPVKTPKDTDPDLDKAHAYVAEDLMYRHWDHWVTETPRTYVSDWNEKALETGKKFNVITESGSKDILGNEPFELPLEPFGGTEQLSWSPDGKQIAYSCKKLTGKEYAFSTNTDIYIYDVESGKSVLVSEGCRGYDNNPTWSPDGSKIAWVSMKRDGYEADKTCLLVYNLKTKSIDNLTDDFKYNVADPVWSDDSKHIYFNALTEGLQAIYKTVSEIPGKSIGGTDEAEGSVQENNLREDRISRITSEKSWYDFHSPFAILSDGTLLTSYCSMDFPNELVAVTDKGEINRITKENDHILSQLTPHKTEMKFIKTTDGQDMLTWVLYPPKFDSSKVYPVIEICLGGPQGTLSQGWSYRWNYRLMCSNGYIVVLPNRRGTTAFGQEWTEQISGDYVGQNIQDYISAAKEMKKQPYVGKIAACGASYGGFSVYYLAGIHDNLYDCFIAHAGIFDEKYMYYETEEMWFPNWDNGGLSEFKYSSGEKGPKGDGKTFGGMQQAGSPWSTAPKSVRHYQNSPDKNVTKWTTPILCIHGGMDFRIPYDQGMAAFNCAQMMGVPSKLIVFPNENHWILQPQNALFWHRNYFEWLDKWCKK